MKSTIFTTILLLVTCPVFAATIHVPADQPTIQNGIDAALDGDLVLVAPGTYIENIDFLGKAITMQGITGAVIDGGHICPVVSFWSNETEDTVIDGFTIRNGDAISGGGIFCIDNSSPTIMNCTISENTALPYLGGGIFCQESSPTVINCTISKNSADRGGGIGCQSYSSPTFINCTISENSAPDGDGGGICCNGSSPTFSGCTISRNHAGYDGGGACYVNSSPVVFVNCMIVDNWADNRGGGIYSYDYSTTTITNCTISENAAELGGGIACLYDSTIVITSSILWGDMAWPGKEIWLGPEGYPSELTISYSNIQDGKMGIHVEPGSILSWLEGNINEHPSFVGMYDYHLTDESPCIDAGDPETELAEDIDGDPRPYGAGFDMGADEYVPGPCFIGSVL